MDARERYYFGDFKLYGAGIDHDPQGERGVLQEFDGVDQDYALVIAASPSQRLELVVITLGEPNPSSKTTKGWKAIREAVRAALELRADTADPVVWVEDDTLADTVSSYAAPTITAAGHPFADGDVVLVRRAGAWSLANVSNSTANTFDVAAVAQTELHAIAAADEVYLVEGYWLGMVYGGVSPQDAAGSWYGELSWRFRGSGRWRYSRTAAVVGS